MRLWPIAILDQLPRQQLLGQHRECCALRGKGWGRKHSTVDYVFKHPYALLAYYHKKVLWEMNGRGFKPNEKWWNSDYRGKNLCAFEGPTEVLWLATEQIYIEHDIAYLDECIANLAAKGVRIDRNKALEKMTENWSAK